jgi:putative transposase
MMYPLVRELTDDCIPVTVTCRVLRLVRLDYYRRLATPDATMGSFALLQKNVLNTKHWETREELRMAIVTWIERTYHRRRRQEALGRLTPVEFETIVTTPSTRAA